MAKMGSDDWPAELRALRDEVVGRFFLPPDTSRLLQNLTDLRPSLPHKYSDLASTFETNISAVVATVGIPATLAWTAAEQSHWQRIYSAERIRALLIDAKPGESQGDLEARRGEHALRTASEAMREFEASTKGNQELVADTSRFLLNSLESSNLSAAAQELILQGCVLTWSALEVLSRDLFEAVLNSDPERALAVVQEPTARQRLRSRFTLDELAGFGFDVSSSVGSLLSSQQDFSDLATIKAAILPALSSEPTVAAALDDSRLWVLCQQRHLIIHRRGVIDARYLRATGDRGQIGSRLLVTPGQLDSHIEAVVKAACAMLAAAGKLAASRPDGARGG
jgi:hypothetical protein